MTEGTRYKAIVPDTLDLAERAVLAINALTGATDPQLHYETFHGGHLDHRTPYMSHRTGGPCLQKPVHVLPLLRVMSGSTQNADFDLKMMEALLDDIGPDGLWWLKLAGHPGREEYFGTDCVYIAAQARLIVALLDWHRLDGNPRWLDYVQRLSDGLAKLAITNGDRSWYPVEWVYWTPNGWKQYEPKEPYIQEAMAATHSEPVRAQLVTVGLTLRAFARWYAVSGDQQAGKLMGNIARMLLKPEAWGITEGPTMVDQPAHAFWHGHFHTHTMGMTGVLEYAAVTGDTQAWQFVKRFYEYSRSFGLSRLGFFPAVTGPLPGIRAGLQKEYGPGCGQVDEGCCVADMTWLAVRLSEAGIGDYWEDVDQYVRNHLVEHQLVRRDLIEAMVVAGPEHTIEPRWETGDDIITRNIGACFCGSDPAWGLGWWTMCCNANVPFAMHQAWEAIIRADGDTAQVNVLLNRASRWMDIDSYLPHEGKVVLKNKTARKLQLRIPTWANRQAVRATVNGQLVQPGWLNHYALFEGLKPGDEVALGFPLVETVEQLTDRTANRTFTCHFRGNTLVDIDPRGNRPQLPHCGSDDGSRFVVNTGYPLYRRDHLKSDKAPMKEMERFVIQAT